MTIVRRNSRLRVRKSRPNLWFERIMALLALLNLLIVFFDLSYLPLRDFWLQGKVRVASIELGPIEREGWQIRVLPPEISRFITQYDWVKGIVPHRDTAQYLKRVEQLEEKLVNPEAFNTPEVVAILEDLGDRSAEIIDTNPFALANKSGNLEKIKNLMREYLPNEDDSAKQAFINFWNPNYLAENTFNKLAFFENEIRPLIETNYFRPIDENGGFVDRFELIDFPFSVIFFIEFLGRTWWISRNRTGVSWGDAMLWRWYDILLFIPFWRWLRIIPVIIRFQQADFIDLRFVQKQVSQGLVAGIAEDVTEVVLVRVINQLQGSIRRGEIGKLLSQSAAKPYVDLNDTNEIAEIAKITANLIVYQVLPRIEPEAEALLQHSLGKMVRETPAYQGIKLLPGGDRAASNLTEQLVKQSYQAFAHALQTALEEDAVFDELLKRLLTNFGQAFNSEIRAKQSILRIESLLVALLEEIKINYIQRLSTEDVEEILEQTRALRQTPILK